MIYIYLFIITLIAYTIQSIAGFGCAIFAIPLISLVMDKELILPAFCSLSVLQTFTIVLKDKKHIMKKEFIIMLGLAILAIPIAMFTGEIVDKKIINITIGLYITANSIYGLVTMLTKTKTRKPKSKLRKKLTYALPLLSGFLQTIYGVGGPLIATYMESVTTDKKKFRVMLSLYWFCLNPIIIAGLIINHKINMIHIKYFTLLVPAMFIGVYIGLKVSDKISKRTFQIAIHSILSIIGISLLL